MLAILEEMLQSFLHSAQVRQLGLDLLQTIRRDLPDGAAFHPIFESQQCGDLVERNPNSCATTVINPNVQFVYGSNASLDLGYTRFFGGGQGKLLRDRDFISMDLKYSF